MSEDFYDVVFLNNDTAILHGQRADQTQVYRPLTNEERERVEALERKYGRERDRLLRELAA